MTNQIVKTQTRVKIEQLKLMVQFVLAEYPQIRGDFVKMSVIITNNFNVLCLPSDLEHYYSLQSNGEDYELESRKQEYDIRM